MIRGNIPYCTDRRLPINTESGIYGRWWPRGADQTLIPLPRQTSRAIQPGCEHHGLISSLASQPASHENRHALAWLRAVPWQVGLPASPLTSMGGASPTRQSSFRWRLSSLRWRRTGRRDRRSERGEGCLVLTHGWFGLELSVVVIPDIANDDLEDARHRDQAP